MMNCPSCLILIFTFSLFSIYSNGQTTVPSNQSQSFLNAKSFYQSAIAENLHLYTGEGYYNTGAKGIPFFLSDKMQLNDIFYDGTLYEDVPLLFDIVKQKVIITRFHSMERIQLVSAKIKYFTYGGHRFENFLQETNDKNISTNIYDEIFKGKVSILVKRVKRIKEGLAPEDPSRFVEEDKIFVRKNNNLFQIKNKKSVLNAFADKENLVKSYISKKRFRFKKNIERELIMTAAYYETLIE